MSCVTDHLVPHYSYKYRSSAHRQLWGVGRGLGFGGDNNGEGWLRAPAQISEMLASGTREEQKEGQCP